MCGGYLNDPFPVDGFGASTRGWLCGRYKRWTFNELSVRMCARPGCCALAPATDGGELSRLMVLKHAQNGFGYVLRISSVMSTSAADAVVCVSVCVPFGGGMPRV